MPDQWAPQADLPDILVSPASPRDPLQPAGTAAERERDVAARGDTSSHSGRGGAESSTKGWQSGKAPPLHKRASHTSSIIGGGGGNAGQKSDRSFLGSIAAALPTFSLSSFKLPGAPTFVTVERDDDEPRPSEDEADFLARDEEDEDQESVEVSSDERDDQDGDDDGEVVLTRADGPAPILARGGDGMTGTSSSADQVDLTNSPDLRIEDLGIDGPNIVSDTPAPPTEAQSAMSSGTPKPGFPTLARTPSSAFVSASKEGRINPLTLHAIARRDSEQEAIRMVHERKETERRREDSTQSTVRGGGGAGGGVPTPPQTPTQPQQLNHRSSLRGILGNSPGRSESPTPLTDDERAKLRKPRPTGLGRVLQDDARSVCTSSSGPGFPRSATMSSTASGSRFSLHQPRASTSRGVPDRHRAVSEAHSLAASEGGGDEPGGKKKKKPGFFSRFGKKKDRSAPPPPPLPNSPTSVRGQDSDFDATVPHSPLSEMTPPRGGPAHPTAPAEKIRIVKVRAKGKSHKDFGQLFLAQELVIEPGTQRPSIASAGDDESIHSSTLGDAASIHSKTSRGKTEETPAAGPSAQRKKNAVWATKFSEDGKYLAVGGKDGVVRVWEVLSSPQDRAATLHPTSPLDSAFPHDVPSFGRSASTFAPATRTTAAPAVPAATGSGKKRGASRRRAPVCVMPVFGTRPVREFVGHEADVLDLSWSKNNFLLSSSMDKTVRLWHVSRSECLCAFQHLDFVTSIAFHPKDDRFFLSGSLDCKLRLWNIPEKRVHIWTELPELITSVAFTRDGKYAIAGSFVGVVIFLEVENFRFHSMFAAKSTRGGKNVKGKKVTSLCPFPLPSTTGDRLLVTTNDSRMRLYHASDKIVEAKYAGHENTSSQIRATFSDDGKWIISGSEDRHVYIWDSGLGPTSSGGFRLKKKFKDGGGYESFAMPAHIVTSAIFAPTMVRMHLMNAGDPIFADGRTHLARLERTLSGNSLDLVGTQSRMSISTSAGPSVRNGIDRSDRDVLVPATTRDGSLLPDVSSAEHAIIIVADDETGVISVFRNSPIPPELSLDGKRARHERGPVAGVTREKSKRWSRASATPSDPGR
ncbi:hypothetical protein RHOSPDRAFT_33176 [Rhodotorula sp. JG-1b]|nr:hypothetical protein RHOSPDRAFT_33176 [Rhodotorula sp. JG-1b]